MRQPAITSRHQRVIRAILTSSTQEEAAVACGTSSRSIRRLLSIPTFREELRRARSRALDNTATLLVGGCDDSVRTLRGIVNGQIKPDAVRVQAARVLLDAARAFEENATLEQRLAELEEQFEKTKTPNPFARFS